MELIVIVGVFGVPFLIVAGWFVWLERKADKEMKETEDALMAAMNSLAAGIRESRREFYRDAE